MESVLFVDGGLKDRRTIHVHSYIDFHLNADGNLRPLCIFDENML